MYIIFPIIFMTNKIWRKLELSELKIYLGLIQSSIQAHFLVLHDYCYSII